MKGSRFFALALIIVAMLLVFVQPAAGATATQAGNGCAGTPTEEELTWFGISNGAGSSLPATIPTAGVVTSWTINLAPLSGTLPTPPEVKLQILRHVNDQVVSVIGESRPVALQTSTTTDATTTATTRIPVLPGDLIAAVAVARVSPSQVIPLSFFCNGQAATMVAGAAESPTNLGEEARIAGQLEGATVPVTVQIEPDADGDGFGDLTQDSSSADPFVHDPCSTSTTSSLLPCPRPSISPLRAHATVGKEGVEVSVAAQAAATASVAGQVRVGKSKLMLTSSPKQTQVGKTTKFLLPFSAALKARLAKLSPQRALKMTILATAPGVEPARPRTVKIRGQAARP